MANFFERLMERCFYDDTIERIADSLESIAAVLKNDQNTTELKKERETDFIVRAQSEEWKLLTEMSALLSEIKMKDTIDKRNYQKGCLSTNTADTIQNLLERMTKLIVGDKVFVPAKE